MNPPLKYAGLGVIHGHASFNALMGQTETYLYYAGLLKG